MTEPPEPRHPEEGGGEEDDAAEIQRRAEERGEQDRGYLSGDEDEGVPGTDEWFDAVDDDILLDQLGRGETPDLDDSDQLNEVMDKLAGWRPDVESTPLPPNTDPERIQQIHDLNQQWEGTSAVSAFEELGQQFAALTRLLQGITGPLEESVSGLNTLGEAGQNIIGENLSENWRNEIAQVRAAITTAQELATNLGPYIEQTAARIAAGPGNL